MKRFLREPLVHFLLIGTGLFLAFGLAKIPAGAESGRIVITQGEVEHLAAGFARLQQRPPTAGELEGLLRDYVRGEVYRREALALGLDRDDEIIRQRLRQKMEFLSEDVAALTEPTDAELRAYLQTHPEAFRVERRFSFRQIYLNPDRRHEHLGRDAAQLLAQLKQEGVTADTTGRGDSFLLNHEFDALPISEVAKLFGDKFAINLGELATGQWQGPVESGYGAHLVLVSECTPGRIPALEEVRDAVLREWTNAHRLQANEAFYQTLLKRYRVTVEQPQLAVEKTLAAAPPQ